MTNDEKMSLYYFRKKVCIQRLGGKCNRCGSIDRLEFDHVQKDKKFKAVTELLTGTIVLLLKEINKCQLLCYQCHKEKSKVDNSKYQHGTLTMYKNHRCRCESCRSVWNMATKRWKKNYYLNSTNR